NLYANVEFFAGVVMDRCGLPREMFTPTFASSRVIGWCANILEQAADNRIIRPSARYVGPPPPQPVPDGDLALAALIVEQATEATDELVGALARLVPQLSRSSPPPPASEVAELVSAPATTLLVARLAGDGEVAGTIVGTLTLVLFRIPTAVRAWIEDVVVDESARGRGVASALVNRALEQAAVAGARTVDL